MRSNSNWLGFANIFKRFWGAPALERVLASMILGFGSTLITTPLVMFAAHNTSSQFPEPPGSLLFAAGLIYPVVLVLLGHVITSKKSLYSQTDSSYVFRTQFALHSLTALVAAPPFVALVVFSIEHYFANFLNVSTAAMPNIGVIGYVVVYSTLITSLTYRYWKVVDDYATLSGDEPANLRSFKSTEYLRRTYGIITDSPVPITSQGDSDWIFREDTFHRGRSKITVRFDRSKPGLLTVTIEDAAQQVLSRIQFAEDFKNDSRESYRAHGELPKDKTEKEHRMKRTWGDFFSKDQLEQYISEQEGEQNLQGASAVTPFSIDDIARATDMPELETDQVKPGEATTIIESYRQKISALYATRSK